MKKGFVIGQSNEIIKAGKVYDLHNLYDFVGIVLKTKERRLQLLFESNSQCGNDRLPVSLNFEEIDFLEFSPNFGAQIISGLDEMGYKKPNDRDDVWLMNEQQAVSSDHLFFRMDGGNFVRIHCKNADIYEAAKLTSI